MTPRLSVVCSTLGNHAGLARVLDGYGTQAVEPGSFEVLVVSDRAEPEPAAVEAAIGERDYPVRLLHGEVPGLSANRNAGWRAAAAPLVLFTDNDTIPERQLVAEHLVWHAREPATETAVLGHVRWARELWVTTFMHWLDHGMQFDYPAIDGPEAGWGRFYGANVSIKRELAERVGGFDEERLPYGYEDLDFGYRANALGLRLLYNPDAVVEHLRAYDLPFYKRRVRRLARAEHRFVAKHPELQPWFFSMFSHASRLQRASGRGRYLIRLVKRTTPLVGARAWRSADLYYRQELAPDFLAAWEEAESESASSGGSPPGGPK